MLKILQARPQHYVNRKLPDGQAGFRKGRRTRDQITNTQWIIEKARDSRKTSTSVSLTTLKLLNVDHNKLWKILQETGISEYLTCVLRNVYAGQEGTVSTRHGTTNWFKIGKGVYQSCILSPCLFNLYEQYIVKNARLDEAQAGIKIVRININNLRYAYDTTHKAESREEIKNLLMKVKEENEKVGWKLNIQRTKIMASSPITSWQIDGETMETVTDLFSWAPKSLQVVTTAMKWKETCSLEEKLWPT